MLKDEDVIYLDYTGPRDIRHVLRHSLVAHRLFRGGHPFTSVISTGSGIALSFLPLGRARGIPCHYIESFTRSTGPSLTGKLLSQIPGIALYSQYPGWAEAPWVYAGSVFDTFSSNPPTQGERDVQRVVVTLGTMEDYSFRRLINRALAIIPAGVEVLWQVGCTNVSDLPIRAHRQLPMHDLRAAIAAADVVVAHAGCGSSVAALEVGKKAILVPRQASHGENVDDHQALLASELQARGLAIVRNVEDLTFADLQLAARSSVQVGADARPFKLAV